MIYYTHTNPLQDIVVMCQTVQKLFETKILSMPAEELEIVLPVKKQKNIGRPSAASTASATSATSAASAVVNSTPSLPTSNAVDSNTIGSLPNTPGSMKIVSDDDSIVPITPLGASGDAKKAIKRKAESTTPLPNLSQPYADQTDVCIHI